MVKTKRETFIMPGTAAKIRNGDIEINVARDISRAMSDLNSKSLTKLRISGKVRKMPGDYQCPTYIYHLNANDRIIFTVDDVNIYILDVIDIKAKKSVLHDTNDQSEISTVDVHDYAKVLANLSSFQPQFEAKEITSILSQLVEQHPNDVEIALAYANSLVNLSANQVPSESTTTIAQLCKITEQYPENSAIMAEYAKGLSNLSAKQLPDEAKKTLDVLSALASKYSYNAEIAFELEKGLANLSAHQPPEEAIRTIDLINKLSMKYKDNVKTQEQLANTRNAFLANQPSYEIIARSQMTNYLQNRFLQDRYWQDYYMNMISDLKLYNVNLLKSMSLEMMDNEKLDTYIKSMDNSIQQLNRINVELSRRRSLIKDAEQRREE